MRDRTVRKPGSLHEQVYENGLVPHGAGFVWFRSVDGGIVFRC